MRRGGQPARLRSDYWYGWSKRLHDACLQARALLLEQRGALLHLTFDCSSGLGNCAQHILAADNHADDIDNWNHCFGALPALPRSPIAAHAGDSVALLPCHCSTVCLVPLCRIPICIVQACVLVQSGRRSAFEASLSFIMQLERAVPPV